MGKSGQFLGFCLASNYIAGLEFSPLRHQSNYCIALIRTVPPINTEVFLQR